MKLLVLFLLLIAGTTLAQNPYTVDSLLNTVDAADTTHIQKAIDALYLAKKIEYQKGEARAFYKLGYLYMSKKNYSESLENYIQAVYIRQETGESKEIAKIYVNISFLMHVTGHYKRAIEYATHAIKLKPSKEVESNAYTCLGRSSVCAGNIKEGIVYFKCAIDLKDSSEVWEDIIYLGNAYLKIGKYDSAIAVYWRANAVTYGRSKVIGTMFQSIGIGHQMKKEFQLAELNYLQAMDYDKTGQLCLNYAELLFQLGQRNKAEYYVNEALKLNYDSEHLGRTLFSLERYKEAALVKDCVNRDSKIDYEQRRKESVAIARLETDIMKKRETEALREANDWKEKMLWTGALIGMLASVLVGKYLWDCRYRLRSVKNTKLKLKEFLKNS